MRGRFAFLGRHTEVSSGQSAPYQADIRPSLCVPTPTAKLDRGRFAMETHYLYILTTERGWGDAPYPWSRVRYVGRTMNPRRRYGQHLRFHGAAAYKKDPQRALWLAGMWASGEWPTMWMLAAGPRGQIARREWLLISGLSAMGAPLLNKARLNIEEEWAAKQLNQASWFKDGLRYMWPVAPWPGLVWR